jgi:hypothetical protein
MTVRSPKTEHRSGKESHVVPLFPELRRQLEECVARAPEGAEYVIDERHRRAANSRSGWRSCNLRTETERIIHNAGLKKWHRLFHTLRSSRQT